jgi:hypothetical protein
MICTVSPPTEEDAENGQAGGLLGALPRTRPQRASKRRQGNRARPSAKPVGALEQDPARGAALARAGSGRASARGRGAPIPPQGYEAEAQAATGGSVAPPSGQELLGSLAEAAGDLLHSGLSRGARLLKDALPRI